MLSVNEKEELKKRVLYFFEFSSDKFAFGLDRVVFLDVLAKCIYEWEEEINDEDMKMNIREVVEVCLELYRDGVTFPGNRILRMKPMGFRFPVTSFMLCIGEMTEEEIREREEKESKVKS